MSHVQQPAEEEINLDEIIIETGATSAPQQQQQQPQDNLNALVASITALRESVIQLRNETNTQRADLVQLRQRIEAESTEDSQRERPAQQATNTQLNQVVSSQQPHGSTTTPQPTAIIMQPHRTPPFVDNHAGRLYPLPIFEGSPEDWPLFIACYNDTTAEFNYSNRQNLIRLQKALRGEAKRTVTSLLIHPENVPSVLNELKFSFGRPELLVRSQLQKIQSFPHIAENRLDQILDLASKVRNVVAFFKSARCEHHLINPTLLDSLIAKLPPSKQFEWGRRAAEINTYPTVECFANWLSELARIVALMPRVAERSSLMPVTRQATQPTTSNRQVAVAGGGSRRILHSTEVPNTRRQQRCVLCSQGHALTECRQFNAHNVNERWAVVKRHQLCFGCLVKGHNLLTCQRRVMCAIDGCQRKHHQLLHATTEVSNNANVSTNANESQVEHVYNCRDEGQSTLFKILPVTLFGPRGQLEVFAMFDEGSSISLISEKVAKNLGLQGQKSLLSLQWYGKNKSTEESRKVSVDIRGLDDSHTFAIKNVRTIQNLDLPKQSFDKVKFSHLQTLPVANYAHVKPELLLGLDNSFLSVARNTIESGPNQPIAAKTKLGWMVYGPVQGFADNEARVMLVKESPSVKRLHKLVEDYIATDTLAIKSPVNIVLESDDNMRARKILEDTTRYLGSRYEIGLLWRDDNVKLPSSYSIAQKRLINIEAKMKRDSKFAECYVNEINKYIDKGYARQLSPNEINLLQPTTWYLPHFGVVNVHKPDKLRIVFDAAAIASNMSLNSALLKGPEKAQSLLSILFKFRTGVIAVAGDIQEMFSQVQIRTEDQNAQRFLWRDGDPSKPICVYVMTSMIFGATCSPCCAEYIKNLNAAKFSSEMPRGSDAVINKTYVDDLVISFKDPEEAEQTIAEAVQINKAAGFHLRKFVSNNKTLEASLNNTNNHASAVINLERQADVDKILGMFWNTTTDALEFHFKFFKIAKDILEGKRSPTKRELLGIVMSVYDPFGFLTNITISAKLLLQSLWKQAVTWDEELPPDLAARWRSWWKQFQSVRAVSISRCYSSLIPNADNIQLHIFVDASTLAYAAVAYLRVQKGSTVEVSLVFAKSSCAPLKATTVPRLELQAAVMGCRIKNTIEQSLDVGVNRTVFWSDSQTVILWIRSHTRAYKPFVAHRIVEILASSTIDQWRWVPTTLNVADEATRPKLTSSQTRWFEGPIFLYQDEEHWPRESTLSSTECASEELTSRQLLLCKPGEKFINFTKFSSFCTLVRVMGWVQRFVGNVRKRVRRGELQADELTEAENQVCRMVQHEAYQPEIQSLRNKIAITKRSSLYTLTPYLDEDGLLRVYGRIDAAYCLPLSARRPIILPPHNYVTKLMVADHHKKRHHQNECLIINEIRQRYWVPAIRNVLKGVKKHCPVCIYDRARPSVPLMGQLPKDRLTPYVRPFTYSGVDYCGPFHVAIGRRREKRWIALFTCMTTRAVHLELAENLSTDAFIICLRNFVNRRGVPVRMRSDNGTNFVGAQREMKEAERLFDFGAIAREMSKNKIDWVFNCPADPSSGGCWERLIQCTKRLLEKVFKEEAPRIETFRSVTIEIENIINSRPLTDLPVSPGDAEPLTPNHFLLGCLNSTQTPHPDEERLCLRKQWRIAQNLKDRAWKRWTLEYLPRLLCRAKWRDEAEALKPGALVVICDPSAPRSHWEKGKITEVFPGNDGRIRSANVRTSHGILRRPARQLAALRFCESPEDSPGGGM